MASGASGGRKAFGKLFGNQKYSDLVVKCADQEWKVHKVRDIYSSHNSHHADVLITTGYRMQPVFCP